jgi:hypothetical protein
MFHLLFLIWSDKKGYELLRDIVHTKVGGKIPVVLYREINVCRDMGI